MILHHFFRKSPSSRLVIVLFILVLLGVATYIQMGQATSLIVRENTVEGNVDGNKAERNQVKNNKTDTKSDAIPYQDLRDFARVMERVRNNYVHEISDYELIQNAIKGMLSELDPHSGYLTGAANKNLAVHTKGEFGGLGIQVTMEEGLVKVISPIDDTPAAKAGIQPQDMIVKLDDQPVMGLTLEEAVDIMRGRIGAPINLTIVRKNSRPFVVRIVRDRIEIKSARSVDLGDGYLYLRISMFSEITEKQMHAEIRKALRSKDSIRGLILDLRNNPGGLLQSAIAVTDTFLDQGLIVYSSGRIPSSKSRTLAKPGDMINGVPIVVLVNGGSASGSEIVAGALQDHKRAIIMGTKTFGKGSVQTVYPMGKDSAIKLTTALYYTPGGRSIQATGIVPDIITEAAVIQRAEENVAAVSEADLKDSIANPNLGTEQQQNSEDAAQKNSQENAVQSMLGQDYQLHEALNLLKGLHIYTRESKTTKNK